MGVIGGVVLAAGCGMLRIRFLLATTLATAACAVPGEEDDGGGGGGGKEDGISRFVEVDSAHSTITFRRYIGRALDLLADHDSELAQLTLDSIEAGRVRIDELADLTCADFLRVIRDLPELALEPSDHARLQLIGSNLAATLAEHLDGYMWSNRIYVSKGQTAISLAATLVHEVNHVINRSEVGYYDDLPTSAFLHEYRAFHTETLIDPAAWEGVDLVDHVITEYELDRGGIPAAVLAQPLTPVLLPDAAAWAARRVEADVDEAASCD
jgi:hypothetical protein